MKEKFESLKLDISGSIHDAALKIEINGYQSVAIVDSSDVVIGIITDGDLRRALIAGEDFNKSVSHLLRAEPILALHTLKDFERLDLLKKHSICQLPIVDEEGRLIDICKISEFTNKFKNEARVVIMAGGKGSRLGKITSNTPKPMLKIGSKPVLERLLENFIREGFVKFSISVNYLSEQIIDYFGNGEKLGVQIDYLHETKPLGTAGSLSLLPEESDEPIVVANADLISDINFNNIFNFHKNHNSIATVCSKKINLEVAFGVIVEKAGILHKLDEKPSFEHSIYAGICVLSPECIKHVPNDTFFDMPDLFRLLLEKNEELRVYQINGYWLDIGQKDDLKKAELEIQKVQN